jgi:hypothetical protein
MGWVVSVTPRPRFSPGERTPGTHCTGGWVSLRAGLDTEARGKIICLCRTSKPGRPVCSDTLYRQSWCSGGVWISRGRQKNSEKILPQYHSSTTNITWSHRGLNLVLLMIIQHLTTWATAGPTNHRFAAFVLPTLCLTVVLCMLLCSALYMASLVKWHKYWWHSESDTGTNWTWNLSSKSLSLMIPLRRVTFVHWLTLTSAISYVALTWQGLLIPPLEAESRQIVDRCRVPCYGAEVIRLLSNSAWHCSVGSLSILSILSLRCHRSCVPRKCSQQQLPSSLIREGILKFTLKWRQKSCTSSSVLSHLADLTKCLKGEKAVEEICIE